MKRIEGGQLKPGDTVESERDLADNSRARLHDEGYATITAKNAAEEAIRGREQGRG